MNLQEHITDLDYLDIFSPEYLGELIANEIRKGPGSSITFIQACIDAGADPDSPSYGSMALHVAAAYGRAEIAQMLIDAGASLDARNFDERAPSHFAAMNGHLKVMEALIKAGASLEARECGGKTPLHYAAQEDHDSVLRALLDAGASKDLLDNNGRTPWDVATDSMRTLFPQLRP